MTSMEIYIFSSSSSLPDIVDLFFPHLHPFTQLLNAFIESCTYLRDTYKSTVHNILNMLKKNTFLWFMARDMKKKIELLGGMRAMWK